MAARKNKQSPEPKTINIVLKPGEAVAAALAGLVVLSLFFLLGVFVGRGYMPEEAVPQLAEIMPKDINSSSLDNQTVLKAEELQFMDRLKQKPENHESERPAKEKTKPTAAKKKPDTKPKPQTASKPEQASKPQAASKPGGFNYVYQVAAFRQAEMAVSLQSKISGLGLTTRIEKVIAGGANWYRVLVLFTGHPEETRAMKDKLKTVGINKVMMKSKKAI